MRPRESSAAPLPVTTPKAAGATAAVETGWLPDCVYTGEKFEAGLAFFADAVGRITRFSREPADLAVAHRLAGQAALPGLVNGHSQAFHRAARGRAEIRGRADRDALATWRDVLERAAGRLTGEDLYVVARMAFTEMLLSGVTCVGEFHSLHHQPDGTPWPEPNFAAQEMMRAAHDTGIRLALFNVACAQAASPAGARGITPTADQYVRTTEALRAFAAKNYPADDVWVGVALQGLGAVPPDYLKAVGAYAHAQRLRMHLPVAARAADHAACVATSGRTPVARLAELGLLDKRFTAIHAAELSADEVKLLGAAKATVCACPTSARNLGDSIAPVEKLLAAGVAISLGTDTQVEIDPLGDARLLEYALRVSQHQRAVLAPEVAVALFHAATVAGARSLGATGGALEVGRPADFFTVNLYDPSIAGAEPAVLLANIVFSVERSAIREVWVGARQRLVNGRHAQQGALVGKFIELQRRLWAV
ncbi:MAG: formimidoylglutamate deiminase [Opitutus sp.]|nr:formimidoylglutamate deiminase [Opitutus sp.]